MAYAEKVYKVRNGKQTKQYTWRARFKRPDGTWGSEPGFPTKNLAKEWGEGQEASIREGRWIDPALSRVTFGTFTKKWMAAQTPRGRTVINRWELLERHILPRWEHTPLHAITWFDVDAWSRTMTCAQSVVGHALTLMSQIMTGAVDARHIQVNPLYGRRKTGKSNSAAAGPRKSSDEEKWAPPETVLRLARRMGPVNGLLVLTTGWTGLRWGEAIGLHRRNTLLTRRQAYDGGFFECPILRVEADEGEVAEYSVREEGVKRKKRIQRLEPPKNATSVRDIDVPPFLAALLQKHLAEWPHDFVFSTPSGTWWWRNNWGILIRPAADGRKATKTHGRWPAKEEWEPIMPGLTMRDLRHTHDTWQAEDNVAPVLAHEQAGHKFPGIKGVYQHPTPEMRQYRLEALQRRFDRAMRNLGWSDVWDA
jgi:integrase